MSGRTIEQPWRAPADEVAQRVARSSPKPISMPLPALAVRLAGQLPPVIATVVPQAPDVAPRVRVPTVSCRLYDAVAWRWVPVAATSRASTVLAPAVPNGTVIWHPVKTPDAFVTHGSGVVVRCTPSRSTSMVESARNPLP